MRARHTCSRALSSFATNCDFSSKLSASSALHRSMNHICGGKGGRVTVGRCVHAARHTRAYRPRCRILWRNSNLCGDIGEGVCSDRLRERLLERDVAEPEGRRAGFTLHQSTSGKYQCRYIRITVEKSVRSGTVDRRGRGPNTVWFSRDSLDAPPPRPACCCC